jgi:hypothetical protein
MTRLGCMHAGSLLERRAAGLSAAEALRLEEHLAGCESCSAEASLLAGLRALSHGPKTALSAATREQAIARAFAQAEVLPTRATRWSSSRALALGGALAAAAALGLGLRASLPARTQPSVPARHEKIASPSAKASADRVLAGALDTDVNVDARALQGALQTSQGATLALAQATVELRPGTTVRWDRARRELRLDAGSVFAEVDPSAHERFAVLAPEFTVQVVGTRFEVTLQGVSVERGRVRVLAPDGHVLAEALGAGGRFTLATEVQPSEAQPSLPSAASESPRALRAKPERHERGDITAKLSQARSELATKRVGGARQLIDAALALEPGPSERAEALSLRAECALVEGDRGAAVQAYLRVARTFAALPAGENALFAAARLEADQGHAAAATRTLERYLARYPAGRFVKEARARLRESSVDPDHAP